MALKPSGQRTGDAPTRAPTRAPTGYEPDPHRSLGYRLARRTAVLLVDTWFRPVVTGAEHVPAAGPVIVAPVHRSFADFGFAGVITPRKLFFMVKDDLWSNPALGRLILSLGGFPVDRAGTDREALRRAQAVLELGQVLVMFPEGTRKQGATVQELHEGAAFLAARTGAPIVPVGIGGSDVAMPKGRRLPRPLTIHVVVGEPIPAPVAGESRRVARTALRATTERLRGAVQSAYDEARARFERA